MRCGPHRTFDGNYKACVLIGSTRSIRNEDKPTIVYREEFSPFNCTNKKPGKYPDVTDCHLYHLCLEPRLYEPFNHLTVECPHSTAYDAKKKKCSKKAEKFRHQNLQTNISCTQPIRFREIRSCKNYFLCFLDQVVQFSCGPGFLFSECSRFVNMNSL